MTPPYDPVEPETWPEEQKLFCARVWQGLHDGDLKPLAAYLRAGHYIEPALAHEIADAIDCEEVGCFHVVTKGRRPGQRRLSQVFEEHDRKMQIGVFMEERISRYGKGCYQAAQKDAFDEFGIKSSATVAKALKYVREYMKNAQGAGVPGRSDEEVMKAVYRFYFTP